LRGPSDHDSATYSESEDTDGTGGYWHDDFIDRACFEGDSADVDDGPEVWDELDSTLVGKEEDLSFDWDEICRRMGFSGDTAALVKARAQGIPRVDMGNASGLG